MKIKCIANSVICLCLLLAGCSDKYVSLQRVNQPPVILTDKDSLTIREKDYMNHFKGAGFMRITVKDSMAPGMHIMAVDSTGNLEVFYDSVKMTKALPLNQASVIYVACKQVGEFPLSITVIDKLEKTNTKTIPVKVVANTPPVASFKMSATDYSPGKAQYSIDASASSSPMSRIVTYTFFIDGVQTTLLTPIIKTTFYTGDHTVGVVVTDDLGAKSMQTIKTVTVL